MLRSCAGLKALLLACVMGLASAQQLQPHYTVCASDFPPMASCNATSDPSTYSGFDIGLFRRAAAQAGWVESVNATDAAPTYEFVCLPFGDMISDLTAPGGNCTVATAGITISSEREDKGIQFSYPTYRSSLAIMVYASPAGDDGWFFFRPFTWQVWLAIMLTVFAIPLITFATEFISIEGRILQRDVVPGMKEASWRSMWCMLLMEPFQVTAISSRVIAIVYGFIATVLVNTYCANLAAALTVSQLNTPINSVEDLRGKAVGTIPVYVPRLGKYGIAPSELEFKGIESAFKDWLPKLRDGTLVATAIDEPVQQYVAALAGCEFRNVATFAPFDFGLAWRKGANASLISTFDDLLLRLQEDGTVSQLRTTYIDLPRTECDSNVNQQTSITFAQVSGLWVILGASVAAGLLWLLGLRAWKRHQMRKQQRAAAAAATKLGEDSEHGLCGSGSSGDYGNGSGAALAQLGSTKIRHGYKAGVAFKQTVSMYGAQIGTNRRDADAAAAPRNRSRDTSWVERDGSGALPPAEQQTVGQLLAHVRDLCDRLEASAETSYMEGGQRVVDERIEEVPQLD